VTLGIFLATAGAFLVIVGLTGRLAIWLVEQFSR
jgi:hypothetical protein